MEDDAIRRLDNAVRASLPEERRVVALEVRRAAELGAAAKAA